MSFVIYNKETTYFLKGKNGDSFETLAAAKAHLTREAKKGKVVKEDYAFAEKRYFHDHIEKKETRIGIVSAAGKEFVVGVNTPWTSGPWSETYWCS